KSVNGSYLISLRVTGLITKVELLPIIKVWPSGRDPSSDEAARTVVPPGLYSITNVVPSSRLNPSNKRRTMPSSSPPAAHGNSTRTGCFEENGVAETSCGAANGNAVAAANRRRRVRFVVFIWGFL